MSTSTETLEFQSEARELLRLVIHSIYSNKDVFLRELVSNASDALDKLRLESFRDKDLAADLSDPRIEIELDEGERTLTVRDNGIGMSRDEVVNLIGTIAKSGTADFLRRLNETKDATASRDLIGQFGVGFYASFMVADQVTVLTRRAGAPEGVRWESDGEGSYTIGPADIERHGTEVILRLKPADAEDHLFDYASPATVRGIIKRYSDFITWPIRLVGGSGEPETLNSMKALWARAKDDVSQDEYNEFYKHISHDWNDPVETILLRAEGTFEYQALLFIPSRAPMDLFMRERKRGVQLYVRRVFIMDDCEALVPDYLRFVKGVVDAQDLSLNVSREILQQDRQIQLIRRRLVKKVLSTLAAMQAEEGERYPAFWDEFGAVVKEGLLGEPDNRDAILGLCLFSSTEDAERRTTLRDYRSRMKDGQRDIYYLTGESRSVIENSPHLEAFRAKGFEVLVLTDPVDEMWVDMVPEFEGARFQSIAKGQIDLDTEQERDAAEAERTEQRERFAALLDWLGGVLTEQVKQVRLSGRLTTSAACIVGDAGDASPALEKLYRGMGQQLPAIKRILELNPGHPLVERLRAAHAEHPDDAALRETAELLYATAVLAEGGELADRARFVTLLTERLTRTI
ncbi:MAG TPA: molecular chaperone HtpG [Pseudonocardia sp.]|jgi:molecular chaperone HtpG